MGISVLILRKFSTWRSDNFPPITTPKWSVYLVCFDLLPHPCVVLGLIIGNSSLHLWWYFWFPTSELQVHLENLVNLCSFSCTYSVKYRCVKYQHHMLPSSCQGWSVGHLAIWLPTPLRPHLVSPSVCSLPLFLWYSPTSFFSPSLDPTRLFSASGPWYLLCDLAGILPGSWQSWLFMVFKCPPPQKTPSWALWVTWSSSSLLLPSEDPCTLPF